MRGKRKIRAELRQASMDYLNEPTDPNACECGHHAGLPALYHAYSCPISVKSWRTFHSIRTGAH